MNLYSMSFGFRQPYQVLVDSEICKSAISQKLDLQKQLYSVLQGEVKPMITQCCIHELYLQGKEQQPAVDLAKIFERRKCNHREAIPGDECLTSIIGTNNKHRYVVATQSHPLRVILRSVPAAPIVHINRSVMVLEPPSDTTLDAKRANEERTLHATLPEVKSVASTSTSIQPTRKKKGPKGPNPLSVKKKKPKERPQPVKASASGEKVSAGLKRKLDEVVDHDVEVRIRNPIEKKEKRRKKSDSDSHRLVDAINDVQ